MDPRLTSHSEACSACCSRCGLDESRQWPGDDVVAAATWYATRHWAVLGRASDIHVILTLGPRVP